MVQIMIGVQLRLIMITRTYIVTLIENDIETIKRNISTIESHLKRVNYQEEINELQNEFKTILVITHRNDVKQYFEKILTVNMTPNGSVLEK